MSKKSPPAIVPELAHLEHVPFSTLTPFQNDLKLLTRREYNKLKKSLTEYGIIFPFYVWVDDSGVCWINDGHQRHRVFSGEGWDHLDVPIIRIASANTHEAKNKLLLASSQYGKITQEGWDTFTADMPQDWLMETVHFDALPFVFGDWKKDEEAANDPYEEWKGMPDYEQDDNFGAIATIKVHFSSEADIAQFAEMAQQTVTRKTTSIWFPPKKRENLKQFRVK